MRQLGQREAKQAIAHQDNHGLMQISNVATIKGVVSAEKLLRAVHCAYQQHPFLRARIEFEGGCWQFFYDVAFDSVQHTYESKKRASIETEMAAEMKNIIAQDKYLWRTRLVNIAGTDQSYFILTTHHSMTDGIACFSLINDILGYYNAIAAGKEVVIESFPERGCLEDYYVQSANVRDMSDVEKNREASIWPVAEPALLQQRMPLIKELVFSGADVAALLSMCRASKVTLNGLLSALIFRASFNVENAPTFIKSSVPINVRSKMVGGLDSRELGAFFDAGFILADKNNTDDLWLMSRDSQAQYQCSVGYNDDISYDELMAFLARLGNEAGSCFGQHIIISNLGRLSAAFQQGDLALIDYRFNASIYPANFFLMFAASTVNDSLTCNFNFTRPLVSEETAIRFVEQFGDEVKQLVAAFKNNAKPVGVKPAVDSVT
ncbi:condensation domain-containing protein [Sinobacterium caligoides]|uniref:Condensation domain-containing protein n=1 Tax=Sinobacterium caligoides TaxID=933926 RepID=A0A3N2E0W3_9GAMM|nr:condensation domain-containing protein [Sinobacterium caligoides]ROS05542.1 condensation domain-containing protein [Sinobacterium caligoides]